jgi:Pectinacetylesterase
MLARRLAPLSLLLAAIGCGGSSSSEGANRPPLGPPITRAEGAPIASAPGWTWVPFPDALCTDATLASGAYQFGTSATGLAVSWGSPSSTDLVVFLQGGGACWDFLTCGGAKLLGIDKTASTGPFGPAEFATDIYARYPNSWIRRANLPAALADATVVFVPYCTGDVHTGDKVTTYAPPIPGLASITWHHVGHANMKAFLKRLGATFPGAGKVVLAGSSAGGFGALANYEDFRAYWPDARSYLVDDSGPPLARDSIPASTRSAWYERWNMGASLDATCPGCRSDLSEGFRQIAARHPQDRVALLSHLQDLTIRRFFGTYTLAPTLDVSPMSATAFEAALRDLGTSVMAPTAGQRFFFTKGTGHPTLEDPTAISTPAPGLEAWLELMLSDSASWTSASE